MVILISFEVDTEFYLNSITLLDSWADQNWIREGQIPSIFYEKTTEKLHSVNGEPLKIKYKHPNAYICNQGYCFKNTFILVKDTNNEIILGTPFITQVYPFSIDCIGIHTNIMGNKMNQESLEFCKMEIQILSDKKLKTI